ncbi:MAG: hypothetical protein H0V37_08550 [Chloroflexia bacterium]|nr:hypothetical protein [Chloroflexia bacterium]
MSTGPVIDGGTIDRAGPDPLGVLSSCAVVVNDSVYVTIDTAAIDRLARDLVDRNVPPPAWDEEIHYRGTGANATEETIGWIFALDALNFCFWGQDVANPAYRWRIASGGTVHDGYLALAITLREAARNGTPIWSPAWQATVDDGALARVFEPVPGSAPIPLLAERVANLQELGRGVQSLNLGNRPFTTFVMRSGPSAPRLVEAIIEAFPSFRDVAPWKPAQAAGPASEVRFLKRAQILVSDLAGALEDNPEVTIGDRDQLTAFADYKVPQVLRHFGILKYGDQLAATIHRRQPVALGSREEVEIRAATISACELIRQRLASIGGRFTASDVDWLLWNLGQSLPSTCEPYHRTVTVFY